MILHTSPDGVKFTTTDFDANDNAAFERDELEWRQEVAEHANNPNLVQFYCDGPHHGNSDAEFAFRQGFAKGAVESLLALQSSDVDQIFDELYELERSAKQDRQNARAAAQVGKHHVAYRAGHEVEASRTRGRCHGLISAMRLFETLEAQLKGGREDREATDIEFDTERARLLGMIHEQVPSFTAWVEKVRAWATSNCDKLEPMEYHFESIGLTFESHDRTEFAELNDDLPSEKATPQFKPVFGVTLDQIWNPGGLIQEIIDYNLRTAHRRQPELALGGAIALLATICGQKVTDASGICPNLYIIGVGASGCGKEQARKVNKTLLFTAGADEMAKDSLASSAGLHTALSNHPSLLLQIDEFGRFMATLGNPGSSPHLSQIVDVLLKLYSQSDSIYTAPCYSDSRKNIRILFPNCVMYATTVPASFFSSLTREALSDGFISRLLIIEVSNNDPDSQETEIADVPESIREAVRWWIDHVPCNEAKLPAPRKLVISPDARAAYGQLDAIVRQNRRAEEARGTQIWVRCVENAKKLALIQQCSLDRESTAISGEAARWGCEFSLMLTARIEQLANEHVSDGAFDARGQKVMRFIRAAGPEGRTRSELSRHVRNATKRELDETLVKLIEMGELAQEPYQPAKGPSGLRFRSLA